MESTLRRLVMNSIKRGSNRSSSFQIGMSKAGEYVLSFENSYRYLDEVIDGKRG